MKSLNLNKTSIFIFILSIMPLADTLNGYLSTNGSSFSIGILYRMTLLIVLLCLCGTRYKKDWVFNGLLLFMMFTSFIHILSGDSVSSEVYDTFYWLLFPLFAYLFFQLSRKRIINNDAIRTILEIYIWLVPLTILIPKFLGMGYSTYSSGQGYKAFYHATNGISFFLGVLTIYCTYKLMTEIRFVTVVQTVLLVFSCIMVGTISVVSSIAIAFCMAVYLIIKKNMKNIFKILLILPVAAGIFFVMYRNNLDHINELITRRIYFIGQYDFFIDFITSGRTEILRNNINMFIHTNTISNLIFGMGKMDRLCEMDFFDIFTRYGLIVLVLYVGCLLHYIKKRSRHPIFNVLIVFSMFYSLITGHVFSNTMSATLFAMMLVTNENYIVE